MYQTVTAIALRTIRHNDRTSILSLWTAELGRVSVSVPADKGRAASRIRALTMPLSPVIAEVDVRPDRNIYRIRDVRPAFVAPAISTDPARSMTAMLLSDFLEVVLRDQQPDRLMTAFILDSIRLFDVLPRAASLNFHIYFLLRLSRFLGIEPDWGEQGSVFDLRDGCFRASEPLHDQFLDQSSTSALRAFSRMNPRNLHRFVLSRTQRRAALHYILLYYTLHHRPVLSLPSLAVIEEM